jgi:hypothetical protein
MDKKKAGKKKATKGIPRPPRRKKKEITSK